MKLFVSLCILAAAATATDIRHPHAEPEGFNLSGWEKVMENLQPKADAPIHKRRMKLPQLKDAGKVNMNEGSRITNGTYATKGQFPWQAAIIRDSVGFCGGSLISTTYVLTAAHCLKGVSYKVVLGAHNSSLSSESSRVIVTTNLTIVHESYNSTSKSNDIGLLKLPSPVELSTYISVIRLPRLSDASNTFAGTLATISGWGLTSSNSSWKKDVLRYVLLPVITNADCAKAFDNVISSTLCCSGADGKAPCDGDSGGPLVYTESDGQKTQLGVVSFGSEAGCDYGMPNAFARVTSFLNWISTNTGITIRP